MTMLNGKPIDNSVPTVSSASTAPPAYPAAAGAAGTVYSSDRQVGLVMGIASLTFAFVFPLVGAILGFIALGMSRRAGEKNLLALTGVIVGIVLTLLIIALVVASIVFGVGLFSAIIDVCENLGEGTHDYNGVTYTCS